MSAVDINPRTDGGRISPPPPLEVFHDESAVGINLRTDWGRHPLEVFHEEMKNCGTQGCEFFMTIYLLILLNVCKR